MAQGKSPRAGQSSFEGPGALAAALDDFDEYILMNPMYYDESKASRESYDYSLLIQP